MILRLGDTHSFHELMQFISREDTWILLTESKNLKSWWQKYMESRFPNVRNIFAFTVDEWWFYDVLSSSKQFNGSLRILVTERLAGVEYQKYLSLWENLVFWDLPVLVLSLQSELSPNELSPLTLGFQNVYFWDLSLTEEDIQNQYEAFFPFRYDSILLNRLKYELETRKKEDVNPWIVWCEDLEARGLLEKWFKDKGLDEFLSYEQVYILVPGDELGLCLINWKAFFCMDQMKPELLPWKILFEERCRRLFLPGVKTQSTWAKVRNSLWMALYTLLWT